MCGGRERERELQKANRCKNVLAFPALDGKGSGANAEPMKADKGQGLGVSA